MNYWKRSIPYDERLHIINGGNYSTFRFQIHNLSWAQSIRQWGRLHQTHCQKNGFLILCFIHKLIDSKSAPFLKNISITRKILLHCCCKLWNDVPLRVSQSFIHVWWMSIWLAPSTDYLSKHKELVLSECRCDSFGWFSYIIARWHFFKSTHQYQFIIEKPTLLYLK